MNRRDFASVLIGGSWGAAASTFAVGASAQPAQPATPTTPTEGTQYTRVDPPVPPATPLAPGKVEVLEFFSYACPHCNAFEPSVEAWTKKGPRDVAFHRVPVNFMMNAENFMRTYYALETMNQVDAMQRKVFAAVHVDRNPLDKPATIAALMAKNGIDATKFLDVFNSFSVATSVTRAKKLMAAYKLDGVPTLTVQGHYATSPGQAGSADGALAVVDYLVQRAHKA